MQDNFDLYLHTFIVTMTVMGGGAAGHEHGAARSRRYHWLSEGLADFLDEPHAAIDGTDQGTIIHLTNHKAAASRRAQL